jgi:hypothetical protein
MNINTKTSSILYILVFGTLLTTSYMTTSLISQSAFAVAICEPDPNTGEVTCNCPEGQHESNGACVPDEIHCGSGTILQGDQCKPITEVFKNQGQCVKTSHQDDSAVSKGTCKSVFQDKNNK